MAGRTVLGRMYSRIRRAARAQTSAGIIRKVLGAPGIIQKTFQKAGSAAWVLTSRGSSFADSPAGASKGKKEPIDLGRERSIEIISGAAAAAIEGMSVFDQHGVDNVLRAHLHKWGVGVTVPISDAVAMRAAEQAGVPIEVYFNYLFNRRLAEALPPRTAINQIKFFDGGLHGAIDAQGRPLITVQELMAGAVGYPTALASHEVNYGVFQRSCKIAADRGIPPVLGHEAAVQGSGSVMDLFGIMEEAVEATGAKGIIFTYDVAASTLRQVAERELGAGTDRYYLGADAPTSDPFVSGTELLNFYAALHERFPRIARGEDLADEMDVATWQEGVRSFANFMPVVGDDNTYSSYDRAREAIGQGEITGLLHKLNQNGTNDGDGGSIDLVHLVNTTHGYPVDSSHRSGEPAGRWIKMAFAVGVRAHFAKQGGHRERTVNPARAIAFESLMASLGQPIRSAGMDIIENPQAPWEERVARMHRDGVI